MGIGELKEGPLHATLKAAYAREGEAEVPVGSFVADAVRDGVIYEIQTGSFSGLRRKLQTLLESSEVVLVHPIAQTTTIVRVPDDPGAATTRRKSPKKGSLINIVDQLVYIPELLAHPNLSVEVLLADIEEIRFFDPQKRRRRGGWRVHEKRLLQLKHQLRLNGPSDLLNFLEDELCDPYTVKELASALGEPVAIAQKMAYCLRHSGVSEMVGKKGHAHLYSVNA